MKMGQGVRTGLGHGGITCVLQTQFSNLYFYLLKKIRLVVSCESSARQRTNIEHQALFPLKNNEKYSRLSSAAVVTGTLRVNLNFNEWRNDLQLYILF